MITDEMTNESITKNAEALVNVAMFEANVWGRKFYRGLVRISRVEDERQDAIRRLRNSRSAIVREAANRLVNHDGNFRWFRYLTQAPMIHIELVARHSSISREAQHEAEPETCPNADPNCEWCGGSGVRIDFFPGSAVSGSTSDCECTWGGR